MWPNRLHHSPTFQELCLTATQFICGCALRAPLDIHNLNLGYNPYPTTCVRVSLSACCCAGARRVHVLLAAGSRSLAQEATLTKTCQVGDTAVLHRALGPGLQAGVSCLVHTELISIQDLYLFDVKLKNALPVSTHASLFLPCVLQGLLNACIEGRELGQPQITKT